MNIDLNRSLVFDSISFFDVYFNYQKINEKMTAYGFDKIKAFKYYNIIINKYKVDNDICAFFYNDNNLISLSMKYYFDNMKSVSNINDYINLLKNENNLKLYFSEYYFNNALSLHENRNEVYSLNIDSNAKISIAFAISDFSFLIEKLIKAIKTVYIYVKEIFENNLTKIETFYLKTNHKKILEETYKDKVLDNSKISISLIRPYIYRFWYIDIYYWFFGYLCHDSIEKERKYFNITSESVASLLANPLNIEVLNIIYENEEITPTDISNLMQDKNTSRATTYRVLNNLLVEKVIYVSRKTKKNVFYSINNEYFSYALIAISEILLYYNKKKGERQNEKVE